MENKKKYSVALLSSGLGHVKRGIETWTEDLGKALYEKQINVSVYKGGGKKDFPYETVIGCFQRDKPITKWIIKNRPGFLWRFGFSSVYTFEQLTFCLNLLPELIFKQFDIIHTQDPQVANYMQKLNRLKLIKSKVILAHGTEEPFEYLAKFDYIQHLAPYHEEEMKSKGILIKENFAIGNFVNTNYFKPNIPTNLKSELNIPKDAFVIISVAAIKKFHKRIDYLINEISLLNNPNVYLIVAGATEAESEEVIALGNTKLKDRVRFLKNFPRTRIQEVFSIANLFVLCSLKEMMPIALLEGLSSGLPAVVHPYPVLKWMIGDGGDTADLSKEGGLKETVEHYYNDKNYLKLKQQKAREHILNCFSKPIILDQIINMYEKVLS